MRNKSLSSIGVTLLIVLLVLLTAPALAQGPPPPERQRAPQPEDSAEAAPQPAAVLQPAAAGSWTYGPDSPFDYTRFDAAFVPGPSGQPWANKVYFLGGRSGSALEDPTIWRFDPVSGTYTDTGLDMIEDVSNYTANVVLDDCTGRGPAIYIIGGYDADNASQAIGTVQRFYPQAGVVEALPSADNWTATVSGYLVSAMGTAVVDDVIYVFGGWENIAAPYFYGGTWAFNPCRPSGSRWTNLGISLGLPRAYIAVAVQRGRIYAMGGVASFDGSDLGPTNAVEMLNPRNLAAGWVGALMPMPIARGEGVGFGFDEDAPGYYDPLASWYGRLYFVGGGDWPDVSGGVMEYMVGRDGWDTTFPALKQPRRDHAGVFVPLCTSNPNDGLPGLWVFGGRTTSDYPPYGDTEFYPLECSRVCNVLLVDDDWDFTTTHGGGRPYYTSALGALGYPYQVWDTVTQGQPSAAALLPYDAVVWFTGYAWQSGVFTADNETQVAAYLNGGGRFFLSSQEYYYAAGLTPFMANYLGVASVTQDVVELDPTGNPFSAVGRGLGHYAMQRPDRWDVYWPTGANQGPYDDQVLPAGGSHSPFLYNFSGQPNSTAHNGGAWRTVYLGWPLEWLDGLGERAQVLGSALDWMGCPPRPAAHLPLVLRNR